MLSNTILLNTGMRYLTEKLGLVDSERFIVLLNREPFNYTQWREENLFAGMTLDEVSDAAEKHWQELRR